MGYKMNKLLLDLIDDNRKYCKEGKIPTYIPELSHADPNTLGIYISTVDNEEYFAGDYEYKFTIQSISKIISLMLALKDSGWEKVFSKVGVNPTSDSFNSIIPLEYKSPDKPLNPMINAGAIATVSLIKGKDADESFERIIEFTKKLCNNDEITINENAFISESKTGNKNRALAYFMKDLGIIEPNVEDVLEIYFRQCAMEITCKDIARIGAMLANDGVLPWNGERVISKEISRVVKTIMVTCGLYDGSGEFAVNIGIPGKSGVGGGIMCAVPGRMGIGVVGTALDKKGNSIAGIKMLEALSKELNLSIF
jgi:glutaminase